MENLMSWDQIAHLVKALPKALGKTNSLSLIVLFLWCIHKGFVAYRIFCHSVDQSLVTWDLMFWDQIVLPLMAWKVSLPKANGTKICLSLIVIFLFLGSQHWFSRCCTQKCFDNLVEFGLIVDIVPSIQGKSIGIVFHALPWRNAILCQSILLFQVMQQHLIKSHVSFKAEVWVYIFNDTLFFGKQARAHGLSPIDECYCQWLSSGSIMLDIMLAHEFFDKAIVYPCFLPALCSCTWWVAFCSKGGPFAPYKPLLLFLLILIIIFLYKTNV